MATDQREHLEWMQQEVLGDRLRAIYANQIKHLNQDQLEEAYLAFVTKHLLHTYEEQETTSNFTVVDTAMPSITSEVVAPEQAAEAPKSVEKTADTVGPTPLVDAPVVTIAE